ncbi:MAG: FecR family protein [Candidatus Neomarinimicrobiota bacterium]|nr:FecR family protein [Candidatus Neomarinimicrobiota bacterium]
MMQLPQKAFPLVLILFSFVIGDKIAVTTKVKGTVELMAVGNKDYLNLKPGTVLSDGDKIRTGKSGFTAVIFIDDKTTLKLKENSEVVITGQRTAASISKKINMDAGTIRAKVSKQNTDFVIQTPTSVASVKGTDFWMITDPVSGDQVIGLEGLVGLVNNETGVEVDVTEGMTGMSTPDGQVDVVETDENTIPDDPGDEEEGPSQIRIYLEGPNGEQKALIIDYQ